MTWTPEEYLGLNPPLLPPNVQAIRNALDLANLRFLKHSEFPVIEADYEKELAWLLDQIGMTVRTPTTVNDPAFHQPSYDTGFRDGNSDIEADYAAVLGELPNFDWPADRGFGPRDVAAVIQSLLEPA